MSEQQKYSSARNFLKRICKYADQHVTGDSKVFCYFIQLYYSRTSLEDLECKTLDEIYQVALSHWELMYQRKSDDFSVRVFNPSVEKEGWTSKYTLIQIVVRDMPFLMDSVSMEINRLNFLNFLKISTGGMIVERDSRHKIIGIERYKGQEVIKGVVEAPLLIEIEKQTNPLILDKIRENLVRVLHDVHMAVHDWPRMSECMRDIILEIEKSPSFAKSDDEQEAAAFLRWLLEDNFTFLGVRDYKVKGSGENIALRLIDNSGLGVLIDESASKKHRLLADMPKEARHLTLSSENRLIISKTNTKSTVHRPVYTDYIGVKRFDEKGRLLGERRFIGLYTSTAYNSDPHAIPFLRHKVDHILKKSELPARSHAGRDLQHILATLPRDDLFQATTSELYELAMSILQLHGRKGIRLFVRKDAYDRYVSCLVFVPRDHFNTQLLRAVEAILMKAFNGVELSFNTQFTASALARIHFIIRIDTKTPPKYDVKEIEKQLVEVGKSWVDELHEQVYSHFGDVHGGAIFTRYKNAFSAGYRESFKARLAVYDIEYIEKLTQETQLEICIYQPLDADANTLRFKSLRVHSTMPLSDALPILENLGFRVVSEQPYEIKLPEGDIVWINDFCMQYTYAKLPNLIQVNPLLRDAFLAVWSGKAENDLFNHLILKADITWREANIFRAYTKYLHQLGFPFSLNYIAETFLHNTRVANILLELFHCLFDPQNERSEHKEKELEKTFLKLLDTVAILDEDRIFRGFLAVIKATLRTNYYQYSMTNTVAYLCFKINSAKIPDMPLPIPAYEIYVYSPYFEGIHLRMAKVARGGIRWSDRREDFRTEVLGLMKAQQVKNSVIVPSGAKGGFIVKHASLQATRDEILKEGIACYQGFIRGLLDITDNLVGNTVVHPDHVVIRDEDDPYLVVAADKGTATFSDIANKIALDKDFWLGDAFASGGSMGYDHKSMAITARGAWVSAKKQFQELAINIDEASASVVGIGDMAGDVFGNGMLLSSHIKLVAAFNHVHIFIDPNPNPQKSFQERKRLFALSRSTWEDYNSKLISKGGGVFSRATKSIALSREIQQLLAVTDTSMEPDALIRAILKAPIDMIWNGGIGTFVKASSESHSDAGDRSNNFTRVNADELRAKVICEGGNLGCTQLGRVEYELNGGKINTDFIDNSAGVDCSDHEVNIKILLNCAMTKGKLSYEDRNKLLITMTDEVAHLVLQDNYSQNQALSLAAFSSAKYIDVYRRFITTLDEQGRLNRRLEFLPEDKVLIDRKNAGLGLTKPELAILLSYAKIIIEKDLSHSSLLSEPYIENYVKDAFPAVLCQKYPQEMAEHRLCKEIIATQLSNRVVADMGITFVYTMFDECNAHLEVILRAYLVACKIFHMEAAYADIKSLDYKIDANIQYEMMIDIMRLVRRAVRWFLRNRREKLDIQKTIDFFLKRMDGFQKRIPKLLNGCDLERFNKRRNYYISAGVPDEIAYRIAISDTIYHALNIVEGAEEQHLDLYHVAKIYFAVLDRLDLLWFRDFIDTYPSDSQWVILAKSAYKGDLDSIQRSLALSVLHLKEEYATLNDRLNAWEKMHDHTVERWRGILEQLKTTETRDLAMLAVAIRELSDITKREVLL